jgi:nitroreductase
VERDFQYPILNDIKKRWSSRAISKEKISKEDIITLIEASRYAPSCFNEQPWRFIIANDENSLKIVQGSLTPSNLIWAMNAPVLIVLISHQFFSQNNKPNFWNLFDTGTAWGYLSLQAQSMGLVSHAMGGFNKNKLRLDLQISKKYDVITIIAIGKPGDKRLLSEDLQDKEKPGNRKMIENVFNFGSFKKSWED